ncbi:unnamed protein product [Arabis nemorensis]|uniref:DUF7903 domain-containing protein n=1 Tax=Arabis nemorensis TaxID=586526 RepID=A0A565BWA7_9BRAS|nr:unnamed protein product [Arabis nemorensis]
MGFNVEETKELYHVKVADKTRPDVTISCKCMAELNALRHLILDVSCLDQDLDMRFSFDRSKCERRFKVAAWEIFLRDSVCGVWHTVATTYPSPGFKSVRRIDLISELELEEPQGKSINEVTVVLFCKFQEEEVNMKCVSDMLKDCLKEVWDYF